MISLFNGFLFGILTLLLSEPAGSSIFNIDIASTDKHAQHLLITTEPEGAMSSCSATAISKNTLLTASHCTDGKILAFYAGGDKITIVGDVVNDGNDHALVTVSKEFKSWACFSPSHPRRGEVVYIIGSPLGWEGLLRVGYLSGFYNGYTLLDMNIWFGDSGAGVFNTKGKIVGVVSVGVVVPQQDKTKPGTFQLAAISPFKFSKEQLTAVGVSKKCIGIGAKRD